MQKEVEVEVIALLESNFSVTVQDEVAVKDILARKIGELLASEPQRLKSIFYRIDLNEHKLGMALVSLNGSDLNEELATQVYERLKKKIETRKQFKT